MQYKKSNMRKIKPWQPIQAGNVKPDHRLVTAPLTGLRLAVQGVPKDLNADSPLSQGAPMKASREVIYLVVDESPARLDLFEFLRAKGHAVRPFASTREFLEFRREDSCACLIVSRRTLGTEQEISKLMSSRSIPVIFTTGRGDALSAVSAMKAGAIDVLTKPVDENALLASVERAFDVDRANRQEATKLGALLDRYESLTPREREILPLLTNGLLNKQAAFELGITEYTVQIHRGHIMRKMEADSFATLVKIATKLKLEPIAVEESNRNG